MLAQQRDGGLQLGLVHAVGVAEDDSAGVLDLVVEELAEVLHIDLGLFCVYDGGKAVEHHVAGDLLHSLNDVGELAHAGGLDQDAVGMILLQHLAQGGGKVAHQRAADAAGVHLGDVDAGLFEKAAVDADLTELVFDQHQLFALIGFGNELFDQRRLAGAKESGENVNLGHRVCFLSYGRSPAEKLLGKWADSRGNQPRESEALGVI